MYILGPFVCTISNKNLSNERKIIFVFRLFSNVIVFVCFPDIPYLRSLHLDRNPLQKVEANAFEMIPQLVSLDLSHCNIKRVAARAFAQLTSLEKLFLQHNQIAELRQKTVESITGEQKPPG